MTHWIVVADAGSCCIWQTDESMSEWAPIHQLVNEPIHRRTADLISGSKGATRSGPGGVRSAFDRHSDPHDVERDRFAREIAKLLAEKLEQHVWERLVLAAPPKFLGLLRAALSTAVAERVVAAIPRDWTRTPAHELPQAVAGHMPEAAGLDRTVR